MTTTATPPAQPPLVEPTREELNAKVERLQRRLEQIYSPEKVVAWLEEGEPLPEVRADPSGTIHYRAKVVGGTRLSKKDAPSQFKISLISLVRNTPIKELYDTPEGNEMDIRISPRAVQAGLPLAFGTAAPGDDAESNIGDEALKARLTALSSRTGDLPDGWEDWEQERKDQVGRWAWAMMLSASDNAIKIPPAPRDIEVWYWGEEALVQQQQTANGNSAWDEGAPPKLRDEDAEIIRNRIAAAATEEGDEAEPSALEQAGVRSNGATRRRRRNGKR